MFKYYNVGKIFSTYFSFVISLTWKAFHFDLIILTNITNHEKINMKSITYIISTCNSPLVCCTFVPDKLIIFYSKYFFLKYFETLCTEYLKKDVFYMSCIILGRAKTYVQLHWLLQFYIYKFLKR